MKSPISLNEAIKKINELKNKYYFRRESELVDLNDSVSRELSETIFADSMSPEFDIAAMDGFAVLCEDAYPLKISGSAYAGDHTVRENSTGHGKHNGI
jgi:molybdopterin molybdotransferase